MPLNNVALSKTVYTASLRITETNVSILSLIREKIEREKHTEASAAAIILAHIQLELASTPLLPLVLVAQCEELAANLVYRIFVLFTRLY